MTRKALRKKRRQQRHVPRRPVVRPASPWIVAGAFVASAALGRTEAHAQVARLVTSANRPAFSTNEEEQSRRFDIPAGSLGEVITAFERGSGLRVEVLLEELKTIASPGVSGDLTNEQALQRLLAGTGVAARFTSPRGVTLEPGGLSDSVDVRGFVPGVSSVKYSAPLREIPQTVEVISRASMEEQGVTTLAEALRGVPGITLQAGEGGGASNTAGDMFNMRGFNAANSLFVDGVRDDGLIARDIFNIEQVEVFMGPTGSDVGRGTAAGYVNMQTKAPSMAPISSALLSYGSANQRRATVDVGRALPLGLPGTWLRNSAFRLNALWQDSGVPGRDIAEQERRAVAPSLALGLNTQTRVTLAAQIMRQDNQPDYGIPGAAWLDEPLAPTTTRAASVVDQSNYYGSAGYDYDKADQTSYLARVEHDLNPRLTFRNQTRHNGTSREAVVSTIQNVAAYDALTGLVTIARQGNERENTITSNQTSLSTRFGTGAATHAASVGLEIAHERQLAPALGGLGTRASVDLFNPDAHSAVTGFAPARTLALTDGKSDTVALYAFDAVDLGARWQVTGGARWEHYDTRFRSVDAAGRTTADLSASDMLLSGKGGLVYRVTSSGNVYASVGTTLTPPGGANFTLSAQANNVNNPNVDPQRSTNFEVGSKWDLLDGRLSLNAAVFHTVNKNIIFTIDATAVPPLFNLDDGQTVDGFSVGAGGRLTSRWQLLGDFSYLDSSQQSQVAANNGMRLTLTPKFSGSLWTTYQLPAGFTLGGGVRYTDEVFINAPNTIKAPGYRLVDGLIEYEVNSHLSLRLNLYNLADETYIRNVNNNGGRYNPGQPRSAVLTSAFSF